MLQNSSPQPSKFPKMSKKMFRELEDNGKKVLNALKAKELAAEEE
jgi:hypothetical protein